MTAGVRSEMDGLHANRHALSAAMADALGGRDPVSLLITGDVGSGKSTLLNLVASRISPREAVRRIMATHALRSVPYGALAAHLRSLGPAAERDPVGILRAVWMDLGSHSAEGRGVVVVVDDAHDLDDASAGVLAEIAASSQLRLLAAAQPHPGMPHALLRLWNDGMAEHHELTPFSVVETAEAAEQFLGGRLGRMAAAVLQKVSGGNPHLLVRLLEEARATGSIVNRDGMWLLTPSFESRGRALSETIGAELAGLVPREREAVVLVALAEPLADAGLLLDSDVLAPLVERGWLRPTPDGLRVAQPMRADAIRLVTTASRKLQMRERLAHRPPPAGPTRLRRLELDLDSGVQVPDEVIGLGLAEALAGGRPGLALKFGRFLSSPGERFRLRAGIARALHDLGDLRSAIEVLEQKPDPAATLESLLAGTLLLAHIRMALGQEAALADDQGRLRARAELLVLQGSSEEQAARAAVEERCRLMDALRAADGADYGTAEALLGDAGPASAGAPYGLRRLIRAERHFALGRFVSSSESATAVLGAADGDGEFLPLADGAVVLQLLSGLLCGNWNLADEDLEQDLATRASGVAARGPMLLFGKAFGLVRTGRFSEASALLPEAIAALRVHDPQQLLGLVTALAASAAAACGDEAQARAWLADAEAAAHRGSHVRRVLAELHRLVARLRLGERQAGLDLQAAASREGAKGLAGLELIAGILALELGEAWPAQRVDELSSEAEGEWVQAWGAWARALLAASAESHLEAGRAMLRLGLAGQARSAYARAAQALDRAGDRAAARRAGSLARQCSADSGTGLPVSPEEQFLAAQQLTPRETSIVVLALDGLTDREIAERLSLSVRTVEGHLHRSYVKLGVHGRDELQDAVLD